MEKDIFHLLVFSLQIAETTSAGPCLTQKPGTPPRPGTWSRGPKDMCGLPLFPRHISKELD